MIQEMLTILMHIVNVYIILISLIWVSGLVNDLKYIYLKNNQQIVNVDLI